MDQALILHESTAARNVSARLSSAEDGFFARRTESGRSLSSLQGYADKWNVVDLSEVMPNPHPVQPHPVGLSALSQQVYDAEMAADAVKRALQVVHKTAKVKILRLFDLVKYVYPHLVPEIRVE